MNAFTLLGEKSVICTISQTAGSSAKVGVENTMYFGLHNTTPISVLLCQELQVLSHAFFHLTDRAQREGGSGVYGRLIITGGLYHESRLGFHLQKSLKSNSELFHSAVGTYHQCHANLKQSIILWIA